MLHRLYTNPKVTSKSATPIHQAPEVNWIQDGTQISNGEVLLGYGFTVHREDGCLVHRIDSYLCRLLELKAVAAGSQAGRR